MRRLSCPDVDELLAGYALDAVTAEEAAAIEEHLRSCSKHDELSELRRTVSLLPLTVSEQEPSPELRQRIVEAARSQDAVPAASSPGRAARPSVLPIRRAVRPPSWAAPRTLAAIAAGLIVALGSGGIGYFLAQQNTGEQVFVFQGNTLAPNATAQVIYFKGQSRALVAVSGLPALPAGKVYEMWLIKGSTPVPAGIATAPDGHFASRIDSRVTDYQEFAITAESGEVSKPTSTPVLSGQL